MTCNLSTQHVCPGAVASEVCRVVSAHQETPLRFVSEGQIVECELTLGAILHTGMSRLPTTSKTSSSPCLCSWCLAVSQLSQR